MADVARRREELTANLEATRRRIATAARDAGRDDDEVTLVVVTKNWPATDVRELAGLGVRHVGENRDQEASPKHDEVSDLDLVWHFIGQLQTNKARSVARYADIVESVDRVRLVRSLDRAATEAGRLLQVLVQVSLDVEPGRGGVAPDAVAGVADEVANAPALDLRGVMGVAPLGEDPRPAFERLASVAAELRRDFPTATVMSAGMSADLEEAIACGATHVRVGSAVLGRRPSVR